MICLPQHRGGNKKQPYELRELAFYERTLGTETVYPFLEQKGLQKGAEYVSPKQLGEKYNVSVQEVRNVNDPGFIDSMKERHITGGISIRCYQKFKPEMIDHFSKSGGFLWNLHPGILPKYRGVMTLARAMANKEQNTSYSLHVIDKDWDSGPILDVRPQRLDEKSTMIANYCRIAPSGAKMVTDNLRSFFKDRQVPAVTQGSANYYSFPKRKDLDGYRQQGLKLVDGKEVTEIFARAFGVPGTEHEKELRARIAESIERFKDENIDVRYSPGRFTDRALDGRREGERARMGGMSR